MDPLQFAYSKGKNTEDAMFLTVNRTYSHLDQSKSGNLSARLMYFDFSSAFNTIQPHLSAEKLIKFDVPQSLVRWILNYLKNRGTTLRVSDAGLCKVSSHVTSDVIGSSTGAPQRTVLAPFLFTTYTSDARTSEPSCPLVEFADDTALIGLVKMMIIVYT